jgi:trehalose 6-phosphate phosphatase
VSEFAESVDPVVRDRVLAVLRKAPAGLFTDIDGTISAIAPTPDVASISDAARNALRLLAARLAVVGVVTGRAADDAAAMLALPDVLVVGNHGMEWRKRADRWVHPSAEASVAALAAALAEVGEAASAAGIVGVVLENKRLSASIHYRLSPEPAAARETILNAATAAADRHGLRVSEGRFVVELRPTAVVNKGTAIADLVRFHALNGVVYCGDDITDVDAFVAIRSLREQGIATISLAVLSAETHPIIESEADVTVNGVPACIELLATLASALSREVNETTDGATQRGTAAARG